MIQYMVDTEILHSDQGIMSIGGSGERQFGKKNFMELFSVFLSPPLVKVFHGKQEIGEVHQSTFIVKEDGPSVLTLGGRIELLSLIQFFRVFLYSVHLFVQQFTCSFEKIPR